MKKHLAPMITLLSLALILGMTATACNPPDTDPEPDGNKPDTSENDNEVNISDLIKDM